MRKELMGLGGHSHNQDVDSTSAQVALVGAGPAGRGLAAALASRGLKVALIDPDCGADWPNTYGVWLDEIDHLEPPIPMRHTFEDAWVYVGDSPRDLGRPYGLVDNQALKQNYDDALQERGALVVEGLAHSVTHGEERSFLHLQGGDEVQADLVIDCSGGGADLLRCVDGEAPGFQRAYGMVVRSQDDLLKGRSLSLMDYRPIPGAPGAPDIHSPTFLYAMALGDDRYFLEETVLVEDEPTSFADLKTRLYYRLDHLEAAVDEVLHEERCHIPMGGALPDFDQPMLAFGAAAGLVHPATGYQMARMLRAVAPLADTIARGFDAGLHRDEICAEGWASIWPQERLRARELLVFGRNVIASFDRDGIASFFDKFFELNDEDWKTFMSGVATHRQISSVMWHLFTSAPMSLRRQLMRRALTDSPRICRALGPMSLGGGAHG